MFALRQEIIPPSGVEFATSLKLTPSVQARDSTSFTHKDVQVLCNLVVARASLLRIFEVREELAPLPTPTRVRTKDKDGQWVPSGTEALEGELEMDEGGEGFINVGEVKSSRRDHIPPPTLIRLYLLREHRLHGIITGLERVRTISSAEDGLDRLLISFKDAKLALMEWTESIHDLTTVSIHTYERAPQMNSLNATYFRSSLRVDPAYRCSALSLPKDALAVLPFYQSQAELDILDQDNALSRDIPYSSSFVLDFQELDHRICNVVDFLFLPGFNNPTIAVLFQGKQTWTGRLKEFKDTVSLFIMNLDLVTRTYPIITQVERLPYDCLYLLACPTSYGGVVVVSSNAIFHIDQAAKVVGSPANGWASRVSDISFGPRDTSHGAHTKLSLEGSHLAYVDERTLLLFLADGAVYPITVVVDGKTVSRLVIGEPLAQTSPAAVLCSVQEQMLFVGSTSGSSLLFKHERFIPAPTNASSNGAYAQEEPKHSEESEGEMDLDDDIYGDTALPSLPTAGASLGSSGAKSDTATELRLQLCDFLPDHGVIADMTFALNCDGDRPVPELVASSGDAYASSFTRFQRDLPTKTKRKLHAIGGSRGLWSFSIKREVSTGGVKSERTPALSQDQSIIVSTDAIPNPGLSRVSIRAPSGDFHVLARVPGVTLAAGPFFQGTFIAHVMPNQIRLLDSGGNEHQSLKDTDGSKHLTKIKSAMISDPYILIQREDDTVALFIGDIVKGRLSPSAVKSTSNCASACLFTDRNSIFRMKKHSKQGTTNGAHDDGIATSTLESAIDSDRGTQWLAVLDFHGTFQIWSLPSMDLVFTSSLMGLLPEVISNNEDADFQDGPSGTKLDIDQMHFVEIGEIHPETYILLSSRSELLVLYKAVPVSDTIDDSTSPAVEHLTVQFVKVFTRILATSPAAHNTRPHPRKFIPFAIEYQSLPYHGVLCTGEKPLWILATHCSPIRVYPSAYPAINACTATDVFGSKEDFLIHSGEGPSLITWVRDIRLGNELPYKVVQTDHPYSAVVFHAETQHLVAAASLRARFNLFDEDGHPVWTPDMSDLLEPHNHASSLELISSDPWMAVDGFDFPQNEFVNALECVVLETQSTETGVKEFVVAATSVFRGEDLAVRGAVYIFEIVEVVPESNVHQRQYRLRLHVRDEAKGPVTAVCGINGYLVSSMGQKIFVRAFEMDERLVGVAFLDVGVYVTSLKTLKNLLLIGDAYKSVSFVAFQEDPFKLVVLGRDVQHVCVSNADFFFGRDGQLFFLVSDDEGVLRIYEFNPTHAESNNGKKLLCRTEFHGQANHRASVSVAARIAVQDSIQDGMDVPSPQSLLLYGTTEGAVVVVAPIDESVFKRLSLLQGQLVRNVQHVAGLNPKAFRYVRNDTVSRPLTKGILDGELLVSFQYLPVHKQAEMMKQIGTERDVVLNDLSSLWRTW